MALKKLDEFEKTGGKKTLTPPKGPRVRRLSDDDATTAKIMIFGPIGSGKTRAILGLLLHGLKVFVLSTDVGGEGLLTVKLELKRMNRLDLLKNLVFVVLDTYDQVTDFVKDPTSIYPQFWEENFDFMIWEGFSGYQQNILSDYVGDMTPARSEGGSDVSDGRASGLIFEETDWGAIRRGTTSPLNLFLKIYNVKTGQVIHKLVTCLEDIKAVKAGRKTTYVDGREPALQGSAKKNILAGFDLILNTRVEETEAGEEGDRSYKYVCAGHETLSGAKKRGLDLPSVMPGDMYKLWEEIAKQMDIKRGAISAEFEKEVSESQN